MSDSVKKIEQAVALQRRGALDQAMQIYVEVLRGDPRNAEALYNIALIACQQEQYEEGVKLARRAIEFGPPQARAHNLLGQALDRLGRHADALAAFDRAIALDPNFPDAHSNRAGALTDIGQLLPALVAYDRVIGLLPNSAGDWCNRAGVLMALGRVDEALRSAERAVSLAPSIPLVHFARGNILMTMGRHEEAAASFASALIANPDYADAHANRGLALRRAGKLDEALKNLDRAVALNPKSPAFLSNRANAMRDAGRAKEAERDYNAALALDPEHASAHFGRAMIHLARGDYKQGFADYEYRGKLAQPLHNSLPLPRWDGAAMPGERLILVGEQGLGDTIQFARFPSLLAERGFDVTLLVRPELAPLMSTLKGITIAASPDDIGRDPRAARWLPLMSAPHVLGTTSDTIPANIPYLSPEPARAAQLSERLGSKGAKIGIVWRAAMTPDVYSRRRTFVPSDLAPLAALPGARMISLQKDAEAAEMSGAGFTIETLGPDFDSGAAFLDSAAAMAHLDLIVTCDTAIAHLAGALGRPVFVALPFLADWRWMREREDSPWYPAARLFRQEKPGEWASVFARMAAAASELFKKT